MADQTHGVPTFGWRCVDRRVPQIKLTARLLGLLLPEFEALLLGQRLDQVYSFEQGLHLVFQRAVLQVKLQTGQPQIGLLSQRPTSGAAVATKHAPSPFAMLLRKHLKGAHLHTISPVAGDRIFHLGFQRGSETWNLVLELTGRHANFFLLNQAQIVLGFWRKDRSQLRSQQTGQPYLPPPLPPARESDLNASEAEISALPADGSRSEQLWQIWRLQEQSHSARAQIRTWDQRLKESQNALARKLRYWQAALERSEAAPQLQRFGELLQGAWHLAPALDKDRANSLLVRDYFQPEQPEVEIPLDPALNFQANLARFFRQAQRLQKTQIQAEKQLLELWQQQSELETWAAQWYVWREQALNDLALEAFDRVQALFSQVAQSAPEAGIREHQPTQKPSQQRKTAALPWREYHTPLGQRIRVGKGAKANEQLLKLARGQDIWLHTRNWPGAYVWIPLNKNEQVRPETLREAAQLALHFSQMPKENKAEIMFTPFKHLQKSRKAKTGTVSVSQFKTLIVSPDQACLTRLFNSQPD